MTIHELIQKLQTLPQDAEVGICAESIEEMEGGTKLKFAYNKQTNQIRIEGEWDGENTFNTNGEFFTI